jgi:hypothetical protein
MKRAAPLPLRKNPAGAHALLLGLALLLAWAVFSPVLNADWFYDDADYVLADPRLDHLELFQPGNWFAKPSPDSLKIDESIVLPGFDRPVIEDRYVWRLSLALERWAWGKAPAVSHAVNLCIHLACVTALFFALWRLLRLYRPFQKTGLAAPQDAWDLLPGLGALIFAIHPWVSEPVCYISARNGSLGTFFALLGTGLWVGVFTGGSWLKKLLYLAAALLCALLALGSKENFITVPAGYVLATAPCIWNRIKKWHRGWTLGIGASVVALLLTVGWLGIQSSDRASGLWLQIGQGRGWDYFFNIQNPLLLQTLGDQIPTQRLSMEFNHPNWPYWACAVALTVNTLLLLIGALGGLRWPVLLGLAWFFLHLLPTNSFLPRPDFLAGRNVYLPMAGVSVLLAGSMLWAWITFQSSAKPALRQLKWGVAGLAFAAMICWMIAARSWAESFLTPETVWRRSAAVAPDHTVVRINLAGSILLRLVNTFRQNPGAPPDQALVAEAEQAWKDALASQSSLTMKYQPDRHRDNRQSLALMNLGVIRTYMNDHVEAARCYQLSWQARPAYYQSWVRWYLASLRLNNTAQLNDAVSAGLRQWPDAWWMQAVRGLQRAGNSAVLPADALADLEQAERQPDAWPEELLSIQRLALFRLAQSNSTAQNLSARMDRLRGMGVPPDEVERLRRSITERLPTPKSP